MPRKSGSPEARAYFKQWYAKNRERLIAKAKIRAQKNRKEINKRAREYYSKKYRAKKLQKLYGMTTEEFAHFDAITACEVCGRSDLSLIFDHDHMTGKVRGRLCNSCNLGLGQLGDSIERIEAVYSYLGRTTWKR